MTSRYGTKRHSICRVFNELTLYSWLALGYNGITLRACTSCLTHCVVNLPEDRMIGQTISHYKILERLGEGGMGVVYKAEDALLERTVALKFLPAELTRDPAAKPRFIREAKAASALDHPNICTIYDIDETEDNQLFIAMAYYEGEALRERISRGPLPLDDTADIAVQIALGLAAAHQKNIVHRDLKTANVFITSNGLVKILDFGLAKLSGVTQLTGPQTTLGTVSYMSPEQTRGGEVDRRSDVWSLGVVLYEMVTGQLPFKGEFSEALVYSILNEVPTPVTGLRSGIPLEFERIINKCLAKDPDKRYQHLDDLIVDIKGLSPSLLVEPGLEPAEPSRTIVRTRAKRTIGWPVAALAAAVGFVAGILLFPGGREEGTLPEPVRIHTLTVSGYDTDPSASPDGRIVAFGSNRDGSPRIWLKQLAGGGEEPLTKGPDMLPRFSPDGSTLLFIRDEGGVRSVYRQPLIGGQAYKLLEDASEAAWSPDAKRIAFVRPWGREGKRFASIGLADADGSGEQTIFQIQQNLASIRWSPDGRTIAAIANSVSGNNPDWRIVLLDVATGEPRYADPSGVGHPMFGLSWTVEGDLILAISGSLLGDQGDTSGRFVRFDLEKGTVTTLFWSQYLFPIQGLRIGDATVSDIVAPETMVFHQSRVRQGLREITLNDPSAAGSGRMLTYTEGRDRQPVYSHDGRRVMFSSNRSGNLDLWTIDPATKQLRQLTDDAAQDWDPCFSPDGGQIVWSSDRSGHLEIWIANADGSAARQLSNDGADAENPTFTSDGEWIVYWSSNQEKLGIWRIRPDGNDATLLVGGAFLVSDVSPNGRYAAYLFQEHDELRTFINVVEIETGKVLPFRITVPSPLGMGNIIFGRVRWLPDGSGLAYIGLDENNRSGVFAQDFIPGKDTSDTRRPLAGFSSDFVSESFGISPDGTRLTLATLELKNHLMLVDGVSGVRPPR
jgi:serine/threonine protein kinase